MQPVGCCWQVRVRVCTTCGEIGVFGGQAVQEPHSPQRVPEHESSAEDGCTSPKNTKNVRLQCRSADEVLQVSGSGNMKFTLTQDEPLVACEMAREKRSNCG
ncbi:unnamed protein product [Caenorhabditis auriculariae]|uniref:Uncharacterized protein n=1 Tax=Caenorhabditis auriculariae TaxID=2777116 RepID=A0A8S1HAW6_9PELO|nr:unnamed protein product [Caenorhabditis auriculariae]